MMYYGGMNTAWAIVCMVAVIAIVALVAWAIVSATNQRGRIAARETPREDAIATLERRYAGGEIDDDEYRRRRNLLAQH
jgi:putative membrane protein